MLAMASSGFAESTEQRQTKQTRFSNDGLYEVSIESQMKPLTLGKMHAWSATIKTPEGAPIKDAKILVSGGMPIHNHGFPTNPQVTSVSDEGVYLIDGVKFSMRGPWILLLDVTVDSQTDAVAFDIDL
jgi:hypothetical protein